MPSAYWISRLALYVLNVSRRSEDQKSYTYLDAWIALVVPASVHLYMCKRGSNSIRSEFLEKCLKEIYQLGDVCKQNAVT